jgi:hypothetical protein
LTWNVAIGGLIAISGIYIMQQAQLGR